MQNALIVSVDCPVRPLVHGCVDACYPYLAS
jgi:hypothetical protein